MAEFEIGDVVETTYNNSKYNVVGIHDHWVWLQGTTESDRTPWTVLKVNVKKYVAPLPRVGDVVVKKNDPDGKLYQLWQYVTGQTEYVILYHYNVEGNKSAFQITTVSQIEVVQ